MDKLKTIDSALVIVSSTFSLATIEQTLSIVILVINILWILFRLIYSVYDRLNKKDIDGLAQDVSETIKELEKLKKGNKEDEPTQDK